MKTIFKAFNHSYYEAVCDFLIELSKDQYKHINWNWARWEWMVFHPDFKNRLDDKIGLWFNIRNELVALATYDHYFGEAFFACKKEAEYLEKEVIEYTIAHFSDENGLGIAVNDTDHHTQDLLHTYGFKKRDPFENILMSKIENEDFDYALPKGIQIKSLNIDKDIYLHQRVLWEGFGHIGNMPSDDETIRKQKRMLSAPHLQPHLHVVAENEAGEFVAYCGCWYHPKTDYAYVEPLCTIPRYRKQGIGKAVLLEALKRCHAGGAKKAFVISDEPFYASAGFVQHSRYTFFWRN